MDEPLCGIQYKVPDDLRAGVRLKVCQLPAGHDGEHAPLPRRVPGATLGWADAAALATTVLLDAEVRRDALAERDAALDPDEFIDPAGVKLLRRALGAKPTELVLAAAQRVVAERDAARALVNAYIAWTEWRENDDKGDTS